MNKKGFTLIELIAVVVIMAIIAMIATPNIINMIDTGKKEQYVSDAKEFISKATYMYKKVDYEDKDKDGKIYLNELEKVKTDDPYGGLYSLDKSYVKFEIDSNTAQRKISIYLTSCEKDEGGSITTTCNHILEGNSEDLTPENVK